MWVVYLSTVVTRDTSHHMKLTLKTCSLTPVYTQHPTCGATGGGGIVILFPVPCHWNYVRGGIKRSRRQLSHSTMSIWCEQDYPRLMLILIASSRRFSSIKEDLLQHADSRNEIAASLLLNTSSYNNATMSYDVTWFTNKDLFVHHKKVVHWNPVGVYSSEAPSQNLFAHPDL